MALMSSTTEDPGLPPPLSTRDQESLLDIAWASIRHGVHHGSPLIPDPDRLSPRLRETGAAFVTLESGGGLRGCIGTLEAVDALGVDVAHNAFRAAFRDPRFPSLTSGELDSLDLHLSILGPPVPLVAGSEAELLAGLEPGKDGLILELPPGHRGTFLPQVWESLPDGKAFLAHLRRKAGLSPDFWSPELRFHRYRMREVG